MVLTANDAFHWRLRKVTRRIVLHSSHTPELANTTAFLRMQGRQKGLLDVGYHYVVERDSRVVCTRPHPAMGSHVQGYNHDSIGVCLAGGHEGRDDFTADQMVAAAQLIGYLLDTYGSIPVQAHSELPTRVKRPGPPCPDFAMQPFMEDYLVPTIEKYAGKTPTQAVHDTSQLSGQQVLILEYLNAGHTLTAQHAMVNLGVGSLSSRIAELRKLGHNIEGVRKTDFKGRPYIKYTLEPAHVPEA